MFGFEDGKDCIETAKYFLKNAGVLEKLTMRTQSYIGENEILKITEELLSSPMKSKKCCIIIVWYFACFSLESFFSLNRSKDSQSMVLYLLCELTFLASDLQGLSYFCYYVENSIDWDSNNRASGVMIKTF